MYRHCVTISFLSLSFSIWERWSIISSGLLKVGESESGSIVSDSLQPHRLYNPWKSLGQNTGLDSLSLLQGIFPTQGSNPGLLHADSLLAEPQGKFNNTGVDSLSLLYQIFLTQESNQGLLHCRLILYQLS